MSLVEQIEKGVRPRVNTSAIREEHESSVCSSEFYDKNSSSSEYPWHVEHCKTEQKAARSLQTHYETPEDIQESVKATFAQKGGSNFKPHHYFDYMAGTSTGGLSAIMLGRMEMSVEKALEQYDLVGNKVFGKPRRLHSKMKLANLLRPKFPARNMESAINQVIKSGLENEIRQWKHFRTEEVPFQSDSQKCRTLVVAHGPVNVTNTVHHTYIFRTYDHLHPSPMSDRENRTKHLNPGRAHRDPIWKVARATSAAPGYFSPIDFGGRTFRDGGMVANNPSSVALTEVLQMHEQRPKLLISIGCGLSELGDEEDTTRSEGGFVNRWTDTAIAASKILTQTEKTQEEVHTSYAFMPAVMYHRFNVGNGLGDIPLDQWKPANSGEKTKSTIEENAQ
ncbi:hypothetical protein LTR16_004200 [Cryomyces antarcticus]|uniref:PNPLA domain-containing protein n=1 Tax=Cryomyces antarcticus TaxID=329879 RepID=A0ABR0LXE3_9PEZI|nr:hypothetical protein LTR16_004200 [Cryomyces antarcticus]